MFKRHRSFVLILLCAALSLLAYFFAKQQPIFFLPPDFDASDPNRYAFLTESNHRSALVVDLEEKTTVGRLALAAIAEHSSMNSNTATLVFSQKDQVFTHALRNGKQQQKQIDSHIEALASGEQSIAVRSQKSLYIFQLPDLHLIYQSALSSQNASLHYAALSSRWLAVENPPSLIVYDQGLKRIALPYQQVSPAALSPDNRFLAFVAKNHQGDDLAVLWSLENQNPVQTFPLHTPSLRPIIDNRSQYVYFLGLDGNGWQFDSRHPQQAPRAFHTLEQASEMALGFLETRLVVRNQKQYAIINTDTLETLATQILSEAGKGIFISANSKTALLGGKRQLFVLSLMQAKLNSIELKQTIEPNAIFMGASNTLCH